MKAVQVAFFIFLFISTTYTQDFLGEYNVHGRVTSGLTTQGLSGISVKYIQLTPDPNTIETFTDADGYYSFTITDINELQPELESKVTYKSAGNKPQITLNSPVEDKATLVLFDILGQEVYKQQNDITPGINVIEINIPGMASSVYLIKLETSQKILMNKIQLPFNNWGNNSTEILKGNKKNAALNKVQEITFALQFRDLTEQHYPYCISIYEPQTIVFDYEYNTPLLPKKNLDIPFINPRNNAEVNTTRDLLFFERGVDYLLYSAYKPYVRPLMTHLNIQDLPAQYSEQVVRDATMEMLAASNLPVDSTLWIETENYIRPQDSESSTIGYKFLDSLEMGLDELSISYIISNERQITSLIFKFNKDLVEPNQVGNFIKYAWWKGIVGERVPQEGYFSNDPRDNISSMTLDENIVYSTLFQYEDRPTWISAENIPENNLDSPSNNFRNTENNFFTKPDIETYSIAFQRDGSVYRIKDGEREKIR